MSLISAARIRAALGQRDAAVALLTRLVDEKLGTPRDSTRTAIDLGEIELAEQIAGGLGDSMGRGFAGLTSSVALAPIAEARGELEAALALYEHLADYHRPRGEPVYLSEALVGLGRVLARLGRAGEAVEALNEARPILVELQAEPMLAETDALLGRLTAASA
jgi:tetratricopeptide (TPR) repeat protein